MEHQGIKQLLSIDNPIERKLALKSKHVTPEHLQIALEDEDPTVREIAARHPQLSDTQIHGILNGDDRWLADIALEHNAIKPEHLATALKHPDLKSKAARHPALTELQRQDLLRDGETPESLNKAEISYPNFDGYELLAKGRKDALQMYKPEHPGTPSAPEHTKWAYGKMPNENWSLWTVRHHRDKPEDFTPEVKEKLEHYAGSQHLPEIAAVRFDKSHDLPKGLELLGSAEQAANERLKQNLQLAPKPKDAQKILDVGDGHAWWNLNQGSCENEGKAMGHCGNVPSEKEGDQIWSLRKEHKIGGRSYYEPHATFIHNNGIVGEMKGRSNIKPAEHYHEAITKLFEHTKAIPVGGGYAPEQNFHIDDLNPERFQRVINANPTSGLWSKKHPSVPTIADAMHPNPRVASHVLEHPNTSAELLGHLASNSELDSSGYGKGNIVHKIAKHPKADESTHLKLLNHPVEATAKNAFFALNEHTPISDNVKDWMVANQQRFPSAPMAVRKDLNTNQINTLINQARSSGNNYINSPASMLRQVAVGGSPLSHDQIDVLMSEERKLDENQKGGIASGLASRKELSPEHIQQLINLHGNDGDNDVVEKLTTNPSLTSQDIDALSQKNNISKWTMSSLAQHPNLSDTATKTIIQKSVSSSAAIRSIALASNATDENLLAILKKPHNGYDGYSPARRVSERTDLMKRPEVMQALLKEPEGRNALAGKMGLPENVYRSLAQDSNGDNNPSRTLAGNPACPPEVLHEIATRKDNDVGNSARLLENPSVASKTLDYLVSSPNAQYLRLDKVVNHPNVSSELIDKLVTAKGNDEFNTTNAWLASAAATKKISPQSLDKILTDPSYKSNGYAHANAASNPNLSEETALKVVGQGPAPLLANLSSNPALTPKTAEAIYANIRANESEFKGSASRDNAKHHLAMNPNTPHGVLRDLATKEPERLDDVAANPNIPSDLVDKVIESGKVGSLVYNKFARLNPEQVDKLISPAQTSSVITSMAHRPDLPHFAYKKLMEVDGPSREYVWPALAENKNLPAEYHEALAAGSVDTRSALAENDSIGSDLHARLLNDPEPWVQAKALNNKHTNLEQCKAFLNDDNVNVRNRASIRAAEIMRDQPMAKSEPITYTESLKRSKGPHRLIHHDDFTFFEEPALGKNIGHITYPEFGEGQIRNLTGYFPAGGLHATMKAKQVGYTDKSPQLGFHVATRNKNPKLSVPEAHRLVSIILSQPKSFPHTLTSEARRIYPDETADSHRLGVNPGSLTPEQAKVVHNIIGLKDSNAAESHEVQHGIFGRLRQKHGVANTRKILNETLSRLSPDHQHHIATLFAPHALGYKPEQHPEEAVTFLHNYLQSPSHRLKTNIQLGIVHNVQKQAEYQTKARKAFQSLQRIAATLKPSDVGLRLKKDEEAIQDWLERLHASREMGPDSMQDHLGVKVRHHALIEAAEFLTGRKVSYEHFRARLHDTDDEVEAVMLAADLPFSERNALEGVLNIAVLSKSEKFWGDPSHSMLPLIASDQFEEDLDWANHNEKVVDVKLGGKHSAGAMFAEGENQELYLIKPESAKVSPAKGIKDDSVSQSRRECAFYEVSKAWGINDVPEACLFMVDGKEAAVIRMLGVEWTGLARATIKNKSLPRQVLQPLYDSGKLFKWSLLDYVLGNTDRHGTNILIGPDQDLALIDHGSAFAGTSFDPGRDNNSFVPYYLRVWTPEKGWSKASPEERAQMMPRLSGEADNDLREWIESLRHVPVENICRKYGIDPVPSLKRLEKIQLLVNNDDFMSGHGPNRNASDALNRLWVDAPQVR